MGKVKSVLIMAGGTGGHIYPGLAVAHLLKEQNIQVHWLGTKKGIESKVVPESGFPIDFIHINGLRGKGLFNILKMPWRLMVAIAQAKKIIRTVQPDVILGMGGFVSGPGGIAGWLLRKKLVIHEQNAKPGLTNRCLASLAERVLEGFPNTFSKRKKVVTTGNPVRKAITLIEKPAERMAARVNTTPRLLILGGSLGARAINELLPRVLATIPLEQRPEVYHQAGQGHLDLTIEAYAKAGVSAKVVSFISEIDQMYAWADFVLCRAGALTIAELCAAGVGAILVPFPHAVDDHQTANANYMAEGGAALLVQQSALTEEHLRQLLLELCHSFDRRISMAEAAYRLRKIDAVEKVCKEVCH